MWDWLFHQWQWPRACAFAAAFLLVVTPFVFDAGGLPLALVFVQLPIYMVHQTEEHVDDRFRRFVNLNIAGGREALTPMATFLINALGVWLFDLVSLFLARSVALPFGLAAGYLAVVNGIAHIGQAVGMRRYNPGLFTGLTLLLPFGGWCVARCGDGVGPMAHAAACSVALVEHALIVALVVSRSRQSHGTADPSRG